MPLLCTAGAATLSAFGFGRGGAVTTWNPLDKSAGVTLSNGNLTAAQTPGAGSQSVRSTTAKSFGKWYYEITINTSDGAFSVPVCNSLQSLGTSMGLTSNSIDWRPNGQIWYNLASVATIETVPGSGGVVGIAVDADSNQVYFRRQGFPLRGPFAAFNMTSTPAFAAPGFGGPGSPCVVTVNFGRTPFTMTPPPGFSPWG